MKDLLTIKDVEKSFSGVTVLRNININLAEGEILGIVGENGAGKSTLMNVLGGVYIKNKGSMTLDGEDYNPLTPKEAKDNGIAFIHQELSLFSNLSIAENMFIEDFPKKKIGGINFKSIVRSSDEYLRNYGLDIDPKEKVENLPMGTRQVVEIIKSLMMNAKIIIFDEPTTSLSKPEKEKLFETIRGLKRKGVSVLFISHIIEDVLTLCNRIAVLRDGGLVGTLNTEDANQNEIVRMMVGRELSKVYPEIEKEIHEDPVLEVTGFNQGQTLKDVSLSIRKGEIIGLYGIIGAGRTELAKAIFGVDHIDSGTVRVNGHLIDSLSPQTCIEKGMAFVTEDRRIEGLLMSKPVRNNITLIKINDILNRLGVINRHVEKEFSDKMVDSLKIKVSDADIQPMLNLSGGNQQKVVFGKWVINQPDIFILDEPTRGVDVGAKFEIYSIIGQMAKDGSGILFISSEMEELIGVCDRILVMKKGRISGEVVRKDFEQETIGNLAL